MTAWSVLSVYSVGIATITAVACARPFLHLLQLESYQFPGYLRALLRVGVKAWLPGALLTAANVALVYGLAWGFFRLAGLLPGLILLANLALAAFVYARLRRRPAKKKLVFTPRLVRLCWALAVVCLLGGLIASFMNPVLPLLWPAFTPVWVALAAWLVQPLEARIKKWFFRDAQRILRGMPELIRIGITGSYGKTSAKFLLATLLAERYSVLATPGSFNTPMGVTRAIREQLRPEHQVFIAEMGARHVGDIREMCELVRPVIGLLTSVGPQHLETFGTVERVAETKYELIQALPPDGAAFFGRDGGICEGLYRRCPLEAKRLAGERLGAEDIAVGPFGCRFTLVGTGGARADCQTRLLGAHNIDNLLLCAEVALHLGLTLPEIAAGVAKLEPVEHRLQLIGTNGGVTVIDDAFNSNPAGAGAALDVLKSFPGRRIVVTPGMVELGAEQETLNEEFGRQMAKSTDIAVLIGGRRVEPIARGLEREGFDRANLHIVSSLEESTVLLKSLARPGDTVLYENDLPEILVYPNPTSGELRIETSDMRYEILEIEIYDMIGRKFISNLKSQISNQTIDISKFSNGIYLVKIETEKGTLAKKIIKK